MKRKTKYATKKGADGKQMAGINRKMATQILGFFFLAYGFLVLSEPTKYATWFNYPDYFGVLGFGLMFAGIVLLFRG